MDCPDFSFFNGGILNRFLVACRIEKAGTPRFGVRILVLVGFALGPIIGLCSFHRTAWGSTVNAPLFYDPAVLARFFFSLPLLILAEKMIQREIRNVIDYFSSSGIIQEKEGPQFQKAVARTNRWASHVFVETVILILTFLAVWFPDRLDAGFGAGVTHWLAAPAASTLSDAGRWYGNVACSIYRFVLLRWLWRYGVWSVFLWSVSRLDLKLSATHPDGKGGLGILAESQAVFAVLALAASAQISGIIGRSMLYDGFTFASHQMLVGGSIAVLVLGIVSPLCVFNGRLYACRREGLCTFGGLAAHYSGFFQRKWLDSTASPSLDLLGNADIQSLADLGAGYERVRRLGLFPWDFRMGTIIGVTAAIPFVPLALFSYGVDQVLLRVIKLLF